MSAEEFTAALCRPVPAFVFHKCMIRAKVHAHGPPAPWTVGDKLRRNAHFRRPPLRQDESAPAVSFQKESLRLQHLLYLFLIIIRFLMARSGTLQQSIISLRVEQPLFVKSAFWKQ